MIGRFDPSDRRTKLILITMVAVYLAVVGVMASMGYYFFMVKRTVIPVLFVAVALSNRFRPFLKDWAIFLSLIVLFDSVRGYIFALITQFDLPVYMGYAISMERALLGGSVAPALLQRLWFEDQSVGLLEKALIVVHASHFLFFLMLGLFIWFLRNEEFWKYAIAMLALMYLGLLGYFLVPTVPPWMAASTFEVLEPVSRIGLRVYNVAIPSLKTAFDTNPVAAMPSLHAAFPTLCSLAALHIFGRRAWWTVVYTLLVALSVIYLGEHYLVDILAGWALGAAVYYAVFRTRLVDWVAARTLTDSEKGAGGQAFALTLRTSLLLALVFLAANEVIGQMTKNMREEFVPTVAFVDRELEGKSPRANLYRGYRAYEERDFRAAQAYFTRAIPEIDDRDTLANAVGYAGKSAFANGDYATCAAMMGKFAVGMLTKEDAIELAIAYERIGEPKRSIATLRPQLERDPDDPELLYWRTHVELKNDLISGPAVADVIARLREHPNRGLGDRLASDLEAMLEARR